MLGKGVLIDILTGIKVGHLVGTGIQDLLVGQLDIGIIGRIEIETEIGIEIETIEGTEVHPVMVMTTQDLEVVQEIDTILILYVDIEGERAHTGKMSSIGKGLEDGTSENKRNDYW